MSVKELECFVCKKIFSVEFLDKVMVYNKNKPYPVSVYLFSNVQQKIPIKYFCSKYCKNKYLSEILEKKYKKESKSKKR